MSSFTKAYHHDTYPDIDPSQPKLSAAGKHVVVTGGGTGIGKSIATSFAKAGAASVAIISRRAVVLEEASKEIAAAGTSTKVTFAAADAADKASLEAAFRTIAEQNGGRIDTLVSNAAGFSGPSTAADTKADALKQDFESNVITSLNVFQAFLPYAAKQPQIFNISSCVAHMAPIPRIMNYTVTKLAGMKLFEYIAMEHTDFHVVNVQPGALLTDMNTLFREQSNDSRKSETSSLRLYGVELANSKQQLNCQAIFSFGLHRQKRHS